jgi:CRP-like cAMP-binding protein
LKGSLHEPQNHLIEQLSPNVRSKFLARCELVELFCAEVLLEPGIAMRYAYFPTAGIIVMKNLKDGHPGLAVGMVGIEGMIGTQLVLGVRRSPMQARVEREGTAWRISASELHGQIDCEPALRRKLHSYIHVLMVQLAEATTCHRFHTVDQRLARWLLMSQDRARSDSLRATQQSLADLLGIRRVGITEAAVALQRGGLIEYRRGDLKILDRVGLESRACSCYEFDRTIYAETSC